MMNTILISCASIAFIGTIIKMIIESSGAHHFSNVISLILGIVILLNIFYVSVPKELPEFSISNIEYNYKQISDDVLKKVVSNTETSVKTRITNELEKRFGIMPVVCNVKIDPESLNVINAKILLNHTDILISVYEIKAFVKEKFEIDAEVYFYETDIKKDRSS